MADRFYREPEWRPIETAPLDGTAVWVWHEGAPYIGYFQAAEMEWDDPPGNWFLHASFRRRTETSHVKHDEIFGTYAHGVKPTHWQPLPGPLVLDARKSHPDG
ncbi:MAG: hypothetical protein KGL39_06200 [Patescibacteria group bacterium]|nr:hypothetical protein [Patescibacteria group bacterium]